MKGHTQGTVILGAGIAGLSAAYHLGMRGVSSVIYEKDGDWGGLCGSFEIGGFRFDRFMHVAFPPEGNDMELFAKASALRELRPAFSNYFRGTWLRHPAINNLAPLPTEEKVAIVADYVRRPGFQEGGSYVEWLRARYGARYAESFPVAYTRKYWGLEAEELETKWLACDGGSRMHVPTLEEVLRGSYGTQDELFSPVKRVFYPNRGGFRSVMAGCREGLDIRLGKRAVKIQPREREVVFADGETVAYGRLISTLPLPEITKMADGAPGGVKVAAAGLRHTQGYQVSLGFNRPDVAKHLAFYVYDEAIPPARVYSPNLKSPDNVPAGCSSLQAEVYFDGGAVAPPAGEVLERTVRGLVGMGLFGDGDIAVTDVRHEPYANVTHVPSIYGNRQIVLEWLTSAGIESIGRFGSWEYLWSHQAFAQGREAADQVARSIDGTIGVGPTKKRGGNYA